MAPTKRIRFTDALYSCKIALRGRKGVTDVIMRVDWAS